ncbi:hypothetical protein Hrd1104_12820 [Halorhabdus sp. CBA1104]|uniref:hypothetical protein n=1 Tax=Halorhabdus sp. CBA1104 TaxID=1380432 RepID=UPI0012B34FBC|nr:hypothetical protein [Halorhabdus sp. CBA1104]QGN08089.1 hypothetical protein Hrd1104_12820 [Halorhabdus sp. CBA1104]
MAIRSRGGIRLVAFSALVVGILGMAAVAGFAIADDTPTGEAVLSNAEEQYQSAESILVEATVTVEHNDTVEDVSITSIATADGLVRANVSDGPRYVRTGYDGTTAWLESSRMDAPIVLSGDLSAGTVSGIGTDATLPILETVALGDGTESSTWSDGIETASGESVQTAVNWSALHENGARSVIPAEWNDSALGERNWSHGPKDGNWSETARRLAESKRSISTLLAETNLTAKRVETTTVDGHDVHVVTITAPEHDGKLTVWVQTDDATVVKQEVTTPHVTVTVDMETTFDISPATSTFQPPTAGASERAVDSVADLRAIADVPVAVPGDRWDLAEGAALQSPVSVVAGQYTADGDSITILQSESALPATNTTESRTLEVDERTVTVTTVPDEQAEETWLELDGGTVTQWTSDGQTVVVAGDLTQEALLNVVEGVEVDAAR